MLHETPTFRRIWRASHATSAALAGLVASVPAALASALVMIVADALHGRDVGETFLLVGHIARVSDSWLVSTLVHLAACAIGGVVFGLLVAFTAHHLAPVAGALWGGFYGVAIWLVGFVLFLPWLQRDLAMQTRTGLLWHIAYGATLGVVFHFARISERRRHRLSAASRSTETAIRPR